MILIPSFQIKKVFGETDNDFKRYDEKFSRSLDENDLTHAIALFYQFHQDAQINIIRETIEKLQSFRRWFEKQTTYHFFASSIIIAYNATGKENQNTDVRIKLVDFAHVFPANDKRDDNFLSGLNAVEKQLNLLLHPEYCFKDVR